jgi:hypothetical protein
MVVVGGGDRHFKMETVQRDGVMCLFKFLSSKNASTKCIFKKKNMFKRNQQHKCGVAFLGDQDSLLSWGLVTGHPRLILPVVGYHLVAEVCRILPDIG